jgi:hypothetical protein
MALPVLGASLLGPFQAESGPGTAPAEVLEFDDDRLRRIDRVTRLGLRGVESALIDGNLAREDPARARCGIFLGNAYGAYEANLGHQRLILEEGGRAASPAVFTNTLANVAAGWISIIEGLKGPMITFASGLLAGAEAIVHAFHHAQEAQGDLLLAGSAYAFHEDVHAALERARGKRLSPPNECAAFLLLAPESEPPGSVCLTGAGMARTPAGQDPLRSALDQAQASPAEVEAALAAGDAAQDEETASRLEGLGFGSIHACTAIFGDLGEAAPVAGAVLAVRWIRGTWAPPGMGTGARSILVAGLDPCGRRAFALRFASGSGGETL